MDLTDDYLEIMIFFIAIMLYSNNKYPNNYWLQVYWLFCNSWIGVICMLNTTLDEKIILVLLLFNMLLNIFYLNQNLKERKIKR